MERCWLLVGALLVVKKYWLQPSTIHYPPSTIHYPPSTIHYPLSTIHYLLSLRKMITQFDTSLPSIRQVQNLIKQTTPVEFKLLTGDVLTGTVLWQDAHCICIADENSQQTTVWKQAIAYIKPKS